MTLRAKDFDFKNTILITHCGCTGGDGPACEILFRAMGGQKENVFAHKPSTKEYSDFLLSIKDDERPIIVADISMSVEEARMFDKRNDVILMDHHKTAIPLIDFDWCEIEKENKRCGSRMFLDWLRKDFPNMDRYTRLVTYIDDYDRWQWKYGEATENLHIMYEMMGVKEFVNRFATGDISLSFEENTQIKFYKKQLQDLINKKVEKTFIKEINGHRYGFVFSERYPSQIGNAMLDFHDIDAACVVGMLSVYVRSRNGFDASQLAKANGGGGHQQASGMPLEKILGESLLSLIINNIDFI